jgi:DNA repair exonuclease SbcCD ATPase subunit
MLGNNEKIEGIKLAEVFSKMLGELPWSSLRNYVQANAPLAKLCTIGGHRLEPNKRERIEKLIFREAQKADFSDSWSNGVFASWYPVHEALHSKLEDYFHSDVYKAYREAEKLSEDDYVLPTEKFDEFFSVDELEEWRILLCFSPLKFSQEQAARILDESQGNAQLLARLKEIENERDDLKRKTAQLSNEAEKLRAKQAEASNEVQELKKQNRQMRQEQEQNQQKLEGTQAEMRRLAQELSQADGVRVDGEKNLREEMQRISSRLQGDLERVDKELSSWQSRYEEQRLANRRLEEQAQEAVRQAKQADQQRSIAEKRESEKDKFADLLLSRIDWTKVGAAMRMTPSVRRNFNSLVRRLNYEEDRSLTIEGTLPEFWEKLGQDEKNLIDNIANSNTREVQTGDMEDYWRSLNESFADVLINLEARMAMLGMLQEIFYQQLEDEDLVEPTLPRTKTKKRSKAADK